MHSLPLLLDAAAAALPAAVPNPPAVRPPGTEALDTILGWMKGLGIIAAVAGIILIAITLMVQHKRGEGSDNLGRLTWVGGGVILLGSSSLLVGALLG